MEQWGGHFSAVNLYNVIVPVVMKVLDMLPQILASVPAPHMQFLEVMTVQSSWEKESGGEDRK